MNKYEYYYTIMHAVLCTMCHFYLMDFIHAHNTYAHHILTI
jgi:hypothetical protein